MIDLHNHILPGVDDGAADLSESVEIARTFLSEGVVAAACTPHLDPLMSRGIDGPEVRRLTFSLRKELEHAEAALDVLPGQEIFLTPELPDLLAQGIAIPLGESRYVLVELSLTAPVAPPFLADTLYRLQIDGWFPILAHPARYPFLQRNREAVDVLAERGTAFQVTAAELSGGYGSSVRRTAEELLRRGICSLGASDRHHPQQSRSLTGLHERIARLTDADTADLLLADNPRRVLDNRPLMSLDIQPPFQRSFFDRLFGG